MVLDYQIITPSLKLCVLEHSYLQRVAQTSFLQHVFIRDAALVASSLEGQSKSTCLWLARFWSSLLNWHRYLPVDWRSFWIDCTTSCRFYYFAARYPWMNLGWPNILTVSRPLDQRCPNTSNCYSWHGWTWSRLHSRNHLHFQRSCSQALLASRLSPPSSSSPTSSCWLSPATTLYSSNSYNN